MLSNEFRPYTFQEVQGQENIVKTLKKQSINNSFFHSYLFHGQYGSGKTSLARILALSANCDHKDTNGNPCLTCESCQSILNGSALDVTELDAASNNGIENIRSVIENVEYLPVKLHKKIYIIDEVHMLSVGAFNALLKTLEEPPEHVIFILATTELNKVPNTIRSRSAIFHFLRIESEKIQARLRYVADASNISITNDALSVITKYSNGSMRDALSNLDRCSVSEALVDTEYVLQMLGVHPTEIYFDLIAALLKQDCKMIASLVELIYGEGTDLNLVVSDMIDILADLIVLKSDGIVSNSEDYLNMAANITAMADIDALFMLSNCLLKLRESLRVEASKSTLLIAFIQYVNNTRNEDFYLIQRLNELEEKMKTISSATVPVSVPADSISNTPAIENQTSIEKPSVTKAGTSSEVVSTGTNKERSEVEIKDDVISNTSTSKKCEEAKKSKHSSEESKPTNVKDSIDSKKTGQVESSNHSNANNTTTKPEKNETQFSSTSGRLSSLDSFRSMFGISSTPVSNKPTLRVEEIKDDTNVEETVKSQDAKEDIDSKVASLSPMVKEVQEEAETLSTAAKHGLELLNSEPIPQSAVRTCKMKMRGSVLVLLSGLLPIRKILKTYIERDNIQDVLVEEDDEITF